MSITKFLTILLSLLVISCSQPPTGPLPIIGNKDITATGDTIYHQIPNFQFINQDSQTVTNATFADRAYVVDFFFISCPTICPKVKKQMLRIHERFEKEPKIALLSHSIDTKYDTVERLHEYATNMEVSPPKWHFVTGEKDEIYDIADDYFSVAIEDESAPGGFDHSGRLILVDKNRHVRAFCDGTDAEEVTAFMGDIERLLAEMD
ncbi:MAG: SCO family protein [Bacteroidota bacterium]